MPSPPSVCTRAACNIVGGFILELIHRRPRMFPCQPRGSRINRTHDSVWTIYKLPRNGDKSERTVKEIFFIFDDRVVNDRVGGFFLTFIQFKNCLNLKEKRRKEIFNTGSQVTRNDLPTGVLLSSKKEGGGERINKQKREQRERKKERKKGREDDG